VSRRRARAVVNGRVPALARSGYRRFQELPGGSGAAARESCPFCVTSGEVLIGETRPRASRSSLACRPRARGVAANNSAVKRTGTARKSSKEGDQRWQDKVECAVLQQSVGRGRAVVGREMEVDSFNSGPGMSGVWP
jgi:hypothetical protein